MVSDAKSLLIVDDQPDNLRVLSLILSEQGYKVRKALSGAIALETAQIQPPDLILLDVNMPHMDGYAVCSAIKCIPEIQDIPIIFLSGSDSTSDKVKAFAVGGADYITKPFQAEEILTRINHQLTIQRQRQQLQQEIQERKQAQAETQLLLKTIQAVNEASNFEDALHAVLCEVREAIGWDYAEAWVPDMNGTIFHLKQACYDLQDEPLKHFHSVSQTYTTTDKPGLLEKIWLSREPIWIVDVSQTSNSEFLRMQIAAAAALKTAFGLPIILDDEVLSVLVFFKRSCSQFDVKLVNLVNAVALQLGGFIRRKQTEEALRQANRELQRLANIDGLTQIANRRCLDDVLHHEWKRLRREQAPLSLILCDVDFFKQFNDLYGHLAGDDCLKQVAQAISASIRRPADLVARYGGEEFVVLLPNTTIEGAVNIAKHIQIKIGELQIPHATSQTDRVVSVSMGITCIIPDADDTADQLIAAADRALYTAKANGRNQYAIFIPGTIENHDSKSL